ncbi:MAG: DNA recombination protein RmuC, partial [Akkermansia sp.]
FNTCSILTGHFSSLGKSLNQAVTQYNKTVSSFEHRFIPRAQKLKNLGVTSTKDLPGSLEDITVQAKSADIPDIPS